MKRFMRAAALVLAFVSLCAAGACAKNIDVRVERVDIYESSLRNFSARIVTPAVSGLAVDKMEEKLNLLWVEHAEELKARYEARIGQALEENPETDENFTFVSDFSVRADDDRLFTVDFYEMKIADFAVVNHTFYTFDKESGMILRLKDLFNERVNFVNVISSYIKDEMRRANKKVEGTYWAPPEDKYRFGKIRGNQNFYINDRGNLVICFDSYQVAPGKAGCPEFEIPMDVVKPYLATDSILRR